MLMWAIFSGQGTDSKDTIAASLPAAGRRTIDTDPGDTPVKTALFAALGATALIAGAATTAASTSKDPAMADNPFAQPSTLPYGMPPFEHIHDSDYLPAFAAGLHEQLQEVDAIARNPQPPTFENTIVALERSGQLRARVESTFSNLNACNTDPEMQKIDTE